MKIKKNKFEWTCPYCGRITTMNDGDWCQRYISDAPDDDKGHYRLLAQFLICPNGSCKKLSLQCGLYRYGKLMKGVDFFWDGSLCLNLEKSWSLLPASCAKVFPDYVPAPIREDYEEACAILETSPKASATLSRRCLQGILRHFYKATGKNLSKEIQSIKDKFEPEVFEAVDILRKKGNIGAHMEKDINLIVDIDDGEAKVLVNFIEMFIDESYVARHNREEKLKKVKALMEKNPQKEQQKEEGNNGTAS